MNIFRQKAISSILCYGISIALMKGLSLIMLPFIASHISPQELGTFEILITTSALASIVIAIGIEDCLFRYSTKNDGHMAMRSFYSWGIIIGLGGSVTTPILSTIFSALSNGIMSPYHLQIALLSITLESAITVPLAYMRMQNHILRFMVFTLSKVFLQATLTYILIINDQGITGLLLASLIASITLAVTLFIYQVFVYGLALRIIEGQKIIRYGTPLLLSGILGLALNSADKIAIASTISLSTLGIYSVACKFALAVVLLMQPFGMWWRPKRMSTLNQSVTQCSSIIALSLFLLSAIAIIVSTAAPILITSLMPDAYHEAAMLAGAAIWIFIFREAYELLNIGALSGDSTKRLMKLNTLHTVIGLACCYLFSLAYGIWGCIAALVLTQLSRSYYVYQLGQAILHPKRQCLLLQRHNILIPLTIAASSSLTSSIVCHYWLEGSINILSMYTILISLSICLLFVLLHLSPTPEINTPNSWRYSHKPTKRRLYWYHTAQK